MNSTQLQESRSPVRSRLRWLCLGVIAAIVALAITTGAYLYHEHLVEQDLLDAIAEADRLDPGWRLEEMEAARAAVPDAENSAILVRAADAGMPATWPTPPPGTLPFIERLAEVPPTDRLPDVELVGLRQEHAKVEAALATARDIADRPRGRHVVVWAPDLIGTLVPHLMSTRRVMQVLVLDAYLRSVDGDGEGALRSCLALLNSGRSVGDEPMAMAQLVRAVCAQQSVRSLERALAHTEVAPASLEKIQGLLADEAEQPSLLIAARFQRVSYFEPLEMMRTGRFDRVAYRMQSSRLGTNFDARVDAVRARAAEAAFLRHTNAVVEIARLPTEIQEERLSELAAPKETLPALIEGLTKDVQWIKLARRFHRAQANLRCGAAALAAERFRLAENRWPADLNALVPRYLAAVPPDPFDGRPLRLRRLPDGVVIYCVNADRADDGGKLDRRDPEAAGTDLGFQLWDANRRERP
jgi:hypothetical protein